MTASKLSGRCLCGNVTYDCDGDPALTAICHCEDCQRQTGTSFSVVVGVQSDALRIDGDSLSTYKTVGEETGNERERKFCSSCGSPIVTVAADMPGLVFIKAGTLDDRSWLEPQMEVWCNSAQPWLESDGERLSP